MKTHLAAIAAALILSASFALAETGGKISVIAERTSPAGKEQTSIQISDDEAIFAANSDFLQGKESKVRLGLFGSELTDGLRKTARELRRIETQAAKEEGAKGESAKAKSTYVSPHSIRVYVGTRSIPFDSPAYRELMSILKNPSRLAEWKPRDAVEVSKPAGADKPGVKSLAGGREATVDCEKKSELKVCEVRPYGLVHAQEKSR